MGPVLLPVLLGYAASASTGRVALPLTPSPDGPVEVTVSPATCAAEETMPSTEAYAGRGGMGLAAADPKPPVTVCKLPQYGVLLKILDGGKVGLAVNANDPDNCTIKITDFKVTKLDPETGKEVMKDGEPVKVDGASLSDDKLRLTVPYDKDPFRIRITVEITCKGKKDPIKPPPFTVDFDPSVPAFIVEIPQPK